MGSWCCKAEKTQLLCSSPTALVSTEIVGWNSLSKICQATDRHTVKQLYNVKTITFNHRVIEEEIWYINTFSL